tara:strand:- start:858 stop:1076 length:219 start_codon:yes stop_codon:yes gene_type:complete
MSKKLSKDDITFELFSLLFYLVDKSDKQKHIGLNVIRDIYLDFLEGKVSADWVWENKEEIADAFRQGVDECK